jgi:hypothetical protein
MSVTRRAVLVGGAAAIGVAAAGCRDRDADEPSPRPDSPDRAALLSAYAGEAGLAAADPASHAEHLAALTAALGGGPSPSVTPTPPPARPDRAAREGVPVLQAAALSAVDGAVAALLASVAAAHTAAGRQ